MTAFQDRFAEEVQGFVYKWVNTINGKWYIGSHGGDISDGYLGSGVAFKNAVKKYGIEVFEREILYNGIDYTSIEEEILIESNAASDKMSYNMKNSAHGWPKGIPLPISDETRKEMSERSKNRVYSEDTLKKKSLAMKGKKLSKETIAKRTASRIANNNYKKTTEQKEALSRKMKGMTFSDEHIANITKSANSIQTKLKKEQYRQKDGQFGTKANT